MKRYLLAIAVIIAAAAMSCSKEKDAKDEEGEAIDKLLARYSDTCFVEHGGIYLYLTEEGTEPYGSSNIVTMIYTGQSLRDNVTFAKNDTLQFVYGQPGLISGFQKALPYIKRGSAGYLLVPYKYGYGDRRIGIIEPYSTLLFTFETEQ